MTALKAYQVDSYLSKPDRDSGLFLVYGRDPGRIREVGGKLAERAAADAGDIVVIEQDELSADPGRVAREVKSGSLFGAAPVVRLRGDGENVCEAVAAVADDLGGATLIVEAGNLKTSDRLRRLAEKLGVALPCYEDDEKSLGRLLRESFEGAGIRVEPEALAMVRASLGQDRAITRNEIEKLTLFAAESKRLTVADVTALSADSAAPLVDAVVDAAGTGDMAGLDAALARCLRAAVAPQQILTLVSLHFARLRRWRAAVDAGAGPDEAIKGDRVHFSRVPALTDQVRRWSDPALAAAIRRLNRATAESRRAGNPFEPMLLRRTLIGLCRMAIAA